jgi:repressor LexA
MQTRTRRQKEVLDFIVSFVDQYGYEPSYQVIAYNLGLNSRAGIAKHIAGLESQGLIERCRENGSFKLRLPQNAAAKLCEIDWIDGSDDEDVDSGPFIISANVIGNENPESFVALRIPDDAMIQKNIESGDVVIIERRTFVRDTTCIAAITEEHGPLLRIFFRRGSKTELHPAADGHDPIILPSDQIQIIGRFRSLIRF